MSMYNAHVSFTKEARRILFARKCIRFLYNREKKLLMVISTPDLGKDTMMIVKSADSNGMSNMTLRDLLEKELKYDLSVVRVRIPGKLSVSKTNAIIFDLNKAVKNKPQKVEK